MLRFKFALALGAILTTSAASGAARKAVIYELNYVAKFLPTDPSAQVSVQLGANSSKVKSLTFKLKDAKRYSQWAGDGEVKVEGTSVQWLPTGNNPTLKYRFLIDHQRKGGAFDARKTPTWALFRGDDLVPSITARTVVNARSRATLRFDVPKSWATETQWDWVSEHLFAVQNPRRRLDRPTGWMLVGEIGVRRDQIDSTDMVIAGPVGEGPRRQDILAFMNWTLPEYRAAFGELPNKFLIVGAADKMWRGGLSGPNSFYLHPDRPLISENGTSSLLHELVHTVQRIQAAPRHDWIVEGMAEFYAVELLHRSGGSSKKRYELTHQWLSERGRSVKTLYISRSSGAVTARAVGILKAADAELRRSTEGKHTLDAVARAMMKARKPVSLKQLRNLTRVLAGRDLKALSDAALPGDELPEDAL